MELLVVDANPILSALLGGAAREVLFSGKFTLYSTQHALFEVAKHLSSLAKRLDVPESDLFREYQLLPITACQPSQYDFSLAEAERWIGGRDPKDVPILALAISLHCPLWTDDRDFDGISVVPIVKTADLLVK
jgi:predicted nucleic acid-binding protein